VKLRIEALEAFEVFGIEKHFAPGESVPAFWTECFEKGLYQKLLYDAADGCVSEKELTGAGLVRAIGHPAEDGGLIYMICAVVREGCRTDGYKIVQVPRATWAVFQGRQASQPAKYIGTLYAQAYRKWLPKSGYIRSPGPDMEVYNVAENGKYVDEVWIPVIKST